MAAIIQQKNSFPGNILHDSSKASYTFARAITPVSELNELLNRMSETVSSLLDFKGCVIRLKEVPKGWIISSYNIPYGLLKILSGRLGRHISDIVFEQKTPLVVNNTSTINNELKVLSLYVKSFASVPLIKGENVIGTIELYNRQSSVSPDISSFTSAEIITLEGLALLASMAIDKAYACNEARRGNEKLSRLLFINSAVRGTLKLERLLRLVLSSITVNDDLGFNRAVLFLFDSEKRVLKGRMGVTPGDLSKTGSFEQVLARDYNNIPNMTNNNKRVLLNCDSRFNKISCNIEIPVDYNCYITRAVKEKLSFNVKDARQDSNVSPIILNNFNTDAYAIVPVIARDKTIGVLWVDNVYSKREITDDDIEFLSGFANEVASTIENARLFEKVCHAENELENIFESISDMIYITDMEFKIVRANKSVSEIVGKHIDEITGRRCFEVFHNTGSPCEHCLHTKTISSKKSQISEVKGFFHENEETWLLSNSPMFDPFGNITGSVHIVRNISEISKLREQLIMSEKLASLGEMAAGVAHAIRNPLVSVGGFARRLEKDLEPPLNDYANIIVKEVARLEGILKETIGFVRNNSDTSGEKVEINTLLASAVELMENVFDSNISIERNICETPLYITGNSGRLKEAFINLIQNAGQAIESSGKIIVKTMRKEDKAIIEITDQGAGISEKEMRHIFDPFFTTKPNGSGIGLAMTHRIINEHNGIIDVNSEPGSGANFVLTLPLASTDDDNGEGI